MKGLLILTTRGILSTAAGAALSGPVGMEKWALIFIFSLYMLFPKQPLKKNVIVSDVQILIFVFMIYNILTGIVTSSFPTVAAFKSISYAIPFCAIISVVSATCKDFDWINYLYKLLTPVMIASAVTIPFGYFKIVNDSFQGVINHPNLFGIVGAIYIVTALYIMIDKPERTNWKVFLMIAIAFVMVYLSESRTGMFSAALSLIVYFVSVTSSMRIKIVAVLVGLIFIFAANSVTNPAAYNEFLGEVEQFIYKRETDNIMESREELMEASKEKYENNRMLGSGFAVPYYEGFIDYKLSLNLTYESGNLPTAVLGDCGWFGSVLFWGYLLYIFCHTKRKNLILFFLPIIVSFGEMAFFATNNVAIYYYLFYGICLSDSD